MKLRERKQSAAIAALLASMVLLVSCNSEFALMDGTKVRMFDPSKLNIISHEDFMNDEELIEYLTPRILSEEALARMDADQLQTIKWFFITWTDNQCTYNKGYAGSWTQVNDECKRNVIDSYVSIGYTDRIASENDRGTLATLNVNGCRKCNAGND